jgi:hypothetical protein
MSLWLYPISKKAGRYFLLNNGIKVDVSLDNYKKLVQSGRLKEDEWWSISQNYHKVQLGDEVYIYTGDQNFGIMGYAIVQDKREDRGTRRLCLNFDLGKCRKLIKQPISAQIVRQWIDYPRNAVLSLQSFELKLKSLLLWPLPPQPIDKEKPNLPGKAIVEITRIIRDTKVSNRLKKLYNNKCQVCGKFIKLANGNYSERHHITAIGRQSQRP